MKGSEIAKVVGLLVAAFPAAQPDEKTTRVYMEMLCDLPFEPSLRAVKRLLSSSRFFPSIAEIREAVTDVTHGPARGGADAWLDVVAAIRSVGYCGTPRFEDPLVASIVDRWGWRRMCLEGDETADRARFIEAYNAMSKQSRIDLVSGVPLSRRLESGKEHDRVLSLASGIGKGGLT